MSARPIHTHVCDQQAVEVRPSCVRAFHKVVSGRGSSDGSRIRGSHPQSVQQTVTGSLGVTVPAGAPPLGVHDPPLGGFTVTLNEANAAKATHATGAMAVGVPSQFGAAYWLIARVHWTPEAGPHAHAEHVRLSLVP
jgi:hypothetical protein